MPSALSWLDTSADEQRRVRELIQLYAQSESRDELGIGQIRDALSDGLFPGTSTLHTRARYFLFIPWVYTLGARTRSGAKLNAWAEVQEKRLIGALKDAGVGINEGLIGRVAGASLKTMPSALYWAALERYRILNRDTAPDLLGLFQRSRTGEDELAERVTQDWHPTLPPAPADFPSTAPGGMTLLPDEAVWLRERMLDAVPGTLLAHLLTDDTPLSEGGPPWLDPACLAATGEPAILLQHARLFSRAMEGAALLYNFLIAEQYEAAGHTTREAPVASYRAALAAWWSDCEADTELLRVWDRAELWSLLHEINPRVGVSTRLFVDEWLEAVVSGAAARAADSVELRALVGTRERRQKGAQSRLVNKRLLRTWSGGSGTTPLVYRWGTVRRVVSDIREGAAGAGA